MTAAIRFKYNPKHLTKRHLIESIMSYLDMVELATNENYDLIITKYDSVQFIDAILKKLFLNKLLSKDLVLSFLSNIRVTSSIYHALTNLKKEFFVNYIIEALLNSGEYIIELADGLKHLTIARANAETLAILARYPAYARKLCKGMVILDLGGQFTVKNRALLTEHPLIAESAANLICALCQIQAFSPEILRAFTDIKDCRNNAKECLLVIDVLLIAGLFSLQSYYKLIPLASCATQLLSYVIEKPMQTYQDFEKMLEAGYSAFYAIQREAKIAAFKVNSANTFHGRIFPNPASTPRGEIFSDYSEFRPEF